MVGLDEMREGVTRLSPSRNNWAEEKSIANSVAKGDDEGELEWKYNEPVDECAERVG